MKSSGRAPKIWITVACVQIFVFLIIGLAFYMWEGFFGGLSALMGGVTGMLPTVGFGWFYFRRTTKDTPKKIVKRFYVGEMLRWCLTVLFFALAFQWKEVRAVPLLLTFILLQSVYMWVLLI